MRRDVHGGVRKKIMISRGTGFKTKIRGKRRRKMVCGNVITENIVQVDTKIISSSNSQSII
jgi:small subunit ribosomal protein S6e